MKEIWKRICLLLAALASGFWGCEGARILAFFPHPLLSHQEVFRPVLAELGLRGHQITYFSGFQWKNKPANVEHRLLDLSFIGELRNKIFDFSLEEINSRTSLLSIMKSPLAEATMLISQRIVRDPIVQELIRSDEKYDLVMTEAFDGYEHFAAFAHKFNATSVVFSARGDSSWANEMSGLSDNPSYMVDYKSPYGTKMGRIERLHNALILLASRFHGYRNLVVSQAFADKFLDYAGWGTRPPLSQLVVDQALILVNSHHSVGHSFPRAPHVKEVGGVSIPNAARALPLKIREFVEEAQHGVIYFSLGNYIDFSSSFKEDTRNLFLKVFSKRKERVLWKWSGEGLQSKPENIMFLRWMPQPDILANNRTKLFISHGGLLSLMEAVNFAIPVVSIVMSEESRKNTMAAKEAGYAMDIDFRYLTPEILNDLINEMINNNKYKKRALYALSLFKDRPLQPIDESVYWIEYVLRHGKVLQPASLHMTYYELQMWDLIIIGGIAALSIGLLIAIIIGTIIAALVMILERRGPTATSLLQYKNKAS